MSACCAQCLGGAEAHAVPAAVGSAFAASGKPWDTFPGDEAGHDQAPRQQRVGEGDMATATAAATAAAAARAAESMALPTHTVETWTLNKGRDEGTGRKRINQYTKLKRLGEGSYGKVVLYQSDDSGERVAVKVLSRTKLRKAVVGGRTALSDAMREVAIMKQLDCPQVLRLKEVIDDLREEKLYLVLEFADKGVAMDPVRVDNAIGEGEGARRIALDACLGTEYLHNRGVVHGDIKPDNLLLFGGGHAKLADLGVSQAFEGADDRLVRSPGTPAFFAPECCRGGGYSGRAADCWALGVTIFCLVFGRYPFLGRTESETYNVIQRAELMLPAECSQELADLLRGLMHPDPVQRLTATQAASLAWMRGTGGSAAVAEL